VTSTQEGIELTTASRVAIRIQRPASGNSLQWNKATGKSKPATNHEMQAFDRLLSRVQGSGGTLPNVRAVGQLEKQGSHWTMMINAFAVLT